EVREPEHIALRLAGAGRIDIHVAPPARFANALLRSTGSAAHVAKLEAIASSLSTSIDAAAAREADIYRRLGLPLIPPELREDAGEIARAREGDTFEDLVALRDIRGIIHCHTVYSDGANTILEMAREADALGMDYLTITDHSPSAHYAR